jgi:hypothetical protein
VIRIVPGKKKKKKLELDKLCGRETETEIAIAI